MTELAKVLFGSTPTVEVKEEVGQRHAIEGMYAVCHKCGAIDESSWAFRVCTEAGCMGKMFPRRIYECSVCGYLWSSRKAFAAHDCDDPEGWGEST